MFKMSQNEIDNQWKDLMVRAQKGDSVAYSHLLKEVIPYIRKKITIKLGAWEASDDLIQDVLIAIHKSKRTFHPSKPFLPWLGAVIRYKMIDQIKMRQKIVEKEILDEEAVTKFSSTENNSIDGELISEALKSLPEGLRRAIHLTKLYGLSTVEAASRENISPEAMRARVSRAYKQLRKSIENELN